MSLSWLTAKAIACLVVKFKVNFNYVDKQDGETIMSAESMLFNGAILCIVLVLVGLAWGFLLLKIQGGEAE